MVDSSRRSRTTKQAIKFPTKMQRMERMWALFVAIMEYKIHWVWQLKDSQNSSVSNKKTDFHVRID